MTQEEFHKLYEQEGEKIYKRLSRLSEEELLSMIANKKNNKTDIWKSDDNYQIWQVLKKKGSKKSILPIFNIVKDLENDYLIRYHACDALFGIAGIQDENFKGKVQYGIETERQKAIEKLEQLLCKVLEKQADIKLVVKPWWKIW